MAACRAPGFDPGRRGPKGVTMRVLMISGNREDVDIRVPALGLACVAAAAENAGHETRLLDLMTTESPREAVAECIRQFQPQTIGLSVRNIDDQRMRNTRFLLDQAGDAVTWCRESTDAPIVLGGAGFSILPQPILDYLGAEMGIQGEGEAVFPELLKRIDKGEDATDIPGVFQKGKPAPIKRLFTKGLDAFPLPDPSLLARSLTGAKDAPVPVQTRRGCPLSCSYCSTPTIEGKLVRWRSPETIVAWMSRWVEEGFRYFYFVDNTFNLPPAYARQLCTRILEAGLEITWRCILFPGGLDERVIEMMARAGCKEVSLGFESGSENILQGMRKPFAQREIIAASQSLRRFGIRTMGFLLLGGPGETKESVRQSLMFAESLNLDSMKLSVGIRIYPHTEVARLALQENLITSEQDLLSPRFYVANGLQDWIYETVSDCIADKPNWIF